MSVAQLLDHTKALFPVSSTTEITVMPLEKGGSDRNFFRIEAAGHTPLILVQYGNQREENRHYVELAHFLAAHGINTPQIHHHDPAAGLIWMQDLGEIDLWAHRAAPWEIRRTFYEKTLTQMARLHALDPQRIGQPPLQPAFDERLYRWEQIYFVENCLVRHFGVVFDPADYPALTHIREKLSILPRVLVHRDFQSQNIMIHEDDAWLIDFQGMRPGLRQYDLASLLYDPYVDLTIDERNELLTFYQTSADLHQPDFLETFHLCGLQRLMQALGAYGFLGYERGKPDFLRHIPKALASLKEIVAKIPNLENFQKVLSSV